MSSKLKRIVFLAPDVTTIGGIPNRIRTTIEHSQNRAVHYSALTKRNKGPISFSKATVYDVNHEKFLSRLKCWAPNETVFIVSNNVLTLFSKDVQDELLKFPIIYMFSGQMAFMLQDSAILLNEEYTNKFRVSKVVSLSEGDILFQQQLGIEGQVKGFLPVEQRHQNTYKPENWRQTVYVGRIDFHAKACHRLIPIAKMLVENGFPPLVIFTTSGANSPDYQRFRDLIKAENCENHMRFVLDEVDKEKIFKDIGILLLPSKKEAFGNVILEAFSYGVPVIAPKYAPGPADLIEHNKSGFLLDHYGEDKILNILNGLNKIEIERLSAGAFEKHKEFSLERHYRFLEELSEEVIKAFRGKNTQKVYPDLSMLKTVRQYLDRRDRAIADKDQQILSLQRDNAALMNNLRTRLRKKNKPTLMANNKGNYIPLLTARSRKNIFFWISWDSPRKWKKNKSVNIFYYSKNTKIVKQQPLSTPGILRKVRLSTGNKYVIEVLGCATDLGIIFLRDARSGISINKSAEINQERKIYQSFFELKSDTIVELGVLFSSKSKMGSEICIEEIAIYALE